jgi:hypothetical protein
MGFPLPDYETAMDWEKKGLVPSGANAHLPATHPSFKDVDDDKPLPGQRPRATKADKKELVKAAYDIVSMTWVVPVYTYSISNSRDAKKLISSKGHQRSAVSLCLGRCHHALTLFADDGIHRAESLGGPRPIIVIMTRMSKQLMDDDNLPPALKYIRDAIADMLGTKDNNPLIFWECQQEKSSKYGVKIQLRLA